jgi:hypothetical protein
MLTRLEQSEPTTKWFRLWDKVLDARNLQAAFWSVWRNAGAPGVDGQTTGQFDAHAEAELARLGEELRGKRYRRQPARRVWIPKPGTTEQRPLGIPTVCSNCTQDQRVFGLGRYHPSVPSAARPEIPYLESKDVLGPAHADFGGRGRRHVFGFAGVD